MVKIKLFQDKDEMILFFVDMVQQVKNTAPRVDKEMSARAQKVAKFIPKNNRPIMIKIMEIKAGMAPP